MSRFFRYFKFWIDVPFITLAVMVLHWPGQADAVNPSRNERISKQEAGMHIHPISTHLGDVVTLSGGLCPPGPTRQLVVSLLQAAALAAHASTARIELRGAGLTETINWSEPGAIPGRDAFSQWLDDNDCGKLVNRSAVVSAGALGRSYRPLRQVLSFAASEADSGVHAILYLGICSGHKLTSQQANTVGRIATSVSDALAVRREHLLDVSRLAAVYVATPALLLLLDGRGYVLAASDLALAHLGYQANQIAGLPVCDLMTLPFATVADYKGTLWLHGGCRDWPCEFLRADGSSCEILLSASVEYDGNGAAVSVKCSLSDISEVTRLARHLIQ